MNVVKHVSGTDDWFGIWSFQYVASKTPKMRRDGRNWKSLTARPSLLPTIEKLGLGYVRYAQRMLPFASAMFGTS